MEIHMINRSLGPLVLAVIASASFFQTQTVLAHPAPFTIDEVMQAPYPSDLSAAPIGNSVAWVFDAKGIRNIWIADGARGTKARQATAFTQDDGYGIGELAWAPDAKSILFSRGEALENDAPAKSAWLFQAVSVAGSMRDNPWRWTIHGR
jgi:hypothetical protein